jgi:hypothetical protein
MKAPARVTVSTLEAPAAVVIGGKILAVTLGAWCGLDGEQCLWIAAGIFGVFSGIRAFFQNKKAAAAAVNQIVK